MAHKGWLYEILQEGRAMSGNVPWPLFPAKSYTLTADDVILSGMNFPVVDVPLSFYQSGPYDSLIEWRSEEFEWAGFHVRLALILWATGPHLYPNQIHQIYFEDEGQYELIDESAFQSNTYQFVTTVGPLQTPIAGAVAEFSNIAQSTAVPY